jgi:hypothetical protein
MKWMLLVLIFGTIPVETGLLFDNIEDCLKAEETMRAEYTRSTTTGTLGRRPIPKTPITPTLKSSCGGATAWRRPPPASRTVSMRFRPTDRYA